jgi:hypothetical protein
MSTPQTRPSTPVSAAAGNVDVLPAGAGISGIGAGYRLKTRLPGKAFPGVRALRAGQVRPAPSPDPAQLVPGQARPHGGHRR